MKRRVVITGMGAITPVGNCVKDYWESIKAGKSGAAPITHFDTTDYATHFACEVKGFNPDSIIDPKEARRMEPFTRYAIVAAEEAVLDAGILNDSIERDNVGVIVGSGIGGMDIFLEQCRIIDKKGPRRMHPFFVPMMIGDIAAGQISIRHGFRGPNFATMSACSTAGHAIHMATRLIEHEEADVMVAGGTEGAISPPGVGGFNAMKALSTRNDAPEKASRPFDRDRDGFVIGEGSGILILEELEHAKKRGAKIYAEIIGAGASGDAYHITAPHPEGKGAVRSMTAALKDAEIAPTEVDYVNAHGTSTDVGDPIETHAIRVVFNTHADSLAVSSTKSMIGHLLGAAGAVELIATVQTICENIIPPTINLENQDPECDLYYVPNRAVERPVNIAISNTFGFGGHNSTIAIRRFES
jgi:3-oxoacyl-[acyl-carrier-protein] synthase II